MAHASAASAQALQAHATGWPQLASSPAWQSVVATVRRVVHENPTLQAAFKTVRAPTSPLKNSAAKDGSSRRQQEDIAPESKHSCDSDNSDSSRYRSGSNDNGGSCRNAAHSSRSYEDPLMYGWLSVHQGPPPSHSQSAKSPSGGLERSSTSTSASDRSASSNGDDATRHAMHAHLDARLSAVYYAAVPSGASHAITFYDPRGDVILRHTVPISYTRCCVSSEQ